MPREDSLSSRFDYLFEPLDDGEPTDAATEIEGSASEPAHATSPPRSAAAPVTMAFAAFVVATLGVVAVIAALLLQRPTEPTDPIEVPLEPTPLSTVASIPSQAAPVPSAPTVAVPTKAPQTIDPGPRQVVTPEPTPTSPPRQTQRSTAISPSTRAPSASHPKHVRHSPTRGRGEAAARTAAFSGDCCDRPARILRTTARRPSGCRAGCPR